MYPKSYKLVQNTAVPITRKHYKDGSCEHKNGKYRENDTTSGIITPRGATDYEDDCKESKPRVVLQNYKMRRENTFSGSPSYDWGSPTLGKSYIEAAGRVDRKRFDPNAVTETMFHPMSLTQENCTRLQTEIELVNDTQDTRARNDIPIGVELANHNLQDTRAHTERTYDKGILNQAASCSSGGYIKHKKKPPSSSTSQSKLLSVWDTPEPQHADDAGLKSTNRRKEESECVKSERAFTDTPFSEDASESNSFEVDTKVRRTKGSDRGRRKAKITAPPNRPSPITSARRALSTYKEDVRNIASRLETFMGKSDTDPAISSWFDQLQLAESKNPWIRESDDGSDKSAKNGHLTQLVSTPRTLVDVHRVAAEKKLCPPEAEAATVKRGGAKDSSTNRKTPGQKRKISATSQKHPPFGQHHRNEESSGLHRSKKEVEKKDGECGREKMVDTTTVATQVLDDENKNESRRRPNLCSDGKRDTNTSTRNPAVQASKSGGSDENVVASQNEGIRQTVTRPAAAWVDPKEGTSQNQRQVDARRTHNHGKGDESDLYDQNVTYEDFEADVDPGNPLERRGSGEVSSLPVSVPGGDTQPARRRRDANQPTTSALEEKNSQDSRDDNEIIARLINKVNELIRGDLTLPSSFLRDAQKKMSLYYPSAKSVGTIYRKNVDPPAAKNFQGYLSNRSISSQEYLSNLANVSQDHTSNPAKDSRDSYAHCAEDPQVHMSSCSMNPNGSPNRKSRRSKSARRSNRRRKSKGMSPSIENEVGYCEVTTEQDKDRRRKEARDASKFRSEELNRIVKRKTKSREARDHRRALASVGGKPREKKVRPKIDSQRYVQEPKASLDRRYFTRPAVRAYGERAADSCLVQPMGAPGEYFQKRDNEFPPHGKGTIDDSSKDNTDDCDASYDTYRQHKSFYLSTTTNDSAGEDDDEIHYSVDVVSERRNKWPKRLVTSVHLDKQPNTESASLTVEEGTEEMRKGIDVDEDDVITDLIGGPDVQGKRREEEKEPMMPTLMPSVLSDADMEQEKKREKKVDRVVPTMLSDADVQQARKREKKVDRAVPSMLLDAQRKQAKKKEKIEITIPSLLDANIKQAKKREDKVEITTPTLLDDDGKQAREREEKEETLIASLLNADIIERRKKEDKEKTTKPTVLLIADIIRRGKREEKERRTKPTVLFNAEEKEKKTKPTMLLNADIEQPRKRKEKAKTTMPTFLNADTKQPRKRERELDTMKSTLLNADTKQPRKFEGELDTTEPTFLNADTRKPRKREGELETSDPSLLETVSNSKQPKRRKAKKIFIIKPKRGIPVSAIRSDLGVDKQPQTDMRMENLLRVWRNESNEQPELGFGQRETLQSKGEQPNVVRALQENAFKVPGSNAMGRREHPGDTDSFQEGDLGANNTVRSSLKQGSLDYTPEPRVNSSLSQIRDADNTFPVTKSRRDIISILLSKLRRMSPQGKGNVSVRKKRIRRRNSPSPQKKKASTIIGPKDPIKPDPSPDAASNGEDDLFSQERSTMHQSRNKSIGAYHGYLKSKQLTDSSLLSSRSQSFLGRQTPNNDKRFEMSSLSQRRTPTPPGPTKGRRPTSPGKNSGSKPQSYKAFLLQPKHASEIDERPACYRFDENKELSDGMRESFRTHSTIGKRKGQTAPTSHSEAETEEWELDDSGTKVKYGVPNNTIDDDGAGSDVGEMKKTHQKRMPSPYSRNREELTSSQKDYDPVEENIMEMPQKERVSSYRRNRQRLTSPQTNYLSVEKKKKKVETAPRATEKVETAPRATEKVETAPRATEKVETAPRATEKVETAPRVPEKVEAAPRATEKVETAPRATEKVETAPRATEKVETAPRATERVETAPRATEKVETAPRATEKVETAPRATEKLLRSYLGTPLSDNPAKHPVEHPVKHPVEHPVKHPVEHPVKHPVEHPVKHPVEQTRTSPTVQTPGMYEDFLQTSEFLFFTDNCSHSICAKSDPVWDQDDCCSAPIQSQSQRQEDGEDQRVSGRAQPVSRTIVVDNPDRGMLINARRRGKERRREDRDTARTQREEEENKRKLAEEEEENKQEEKEEKDDDLKASLTDVLSILEDSVKGETKIKLWRSDKDLDREQRTRELIYRLFYPPNDEESVHDRDRDEEGGKGEVMIVLGEDEEEEEEEEGEDDNDDADGDDSSSSSRSDDFDFSYSSDENQEDRDDDDDDDNDDDDDDDDNTDDSDADDDDDDDDDDDNDDVKDNKMMSFLKTPDVCSLECTDVTSVWKKCHHNEDGDDDTLRGGDSDSDDDSEYNEDDDDGEHDEENEEEEKDDNDKENDDSAEVKTNITSWDYENEEEEEDKESDDEESDKKEGEQEEEGEGERGEEEGERGEEEQKENGEDTENNVEEYSDSTGSGRKTSDDNGENDDEHDGEDDDV